MTPSEKDLIEILQTLVADRRHLHERVAELTSQYGQLQAQAHRNMAMLLEAIAALNARVDRMTDRSRSVAPPR